MKQKPIIRRAQFDQDIEDAIDYYLNESSEQAAMGLIDGLEQTFDHISRHPASGSPRYAHELNLPGLRHWVVKRYPYIVFYVEQNDHIDVWRLLHEQRDIPAWMHET